MSAAASLTTEALANDTPPLPSPIITVVDLTDERHIAFVKTFQASYDAFRLTPPALEYGAQKKWVRKNVMGRFQKDFGPASKDVVSKVDRYLRNHSTHNVPKTPAPVASPTIPSSRAVSWIYIMGLDKKGVIDPRAAALRAAEGINSQADYLHYFRRARQEVADSLPEVEISKYKKLAETETQARKAPPTPASVFDRQPYIIDQLNSTIQKRIGWDVGQFGNVVCFLAIAFRTKDHSISTNLSVVSNQYLPTNEMIIPTLSEDFNKFIGPSFMGLAQNYLPRIDIQQPRLELDIDEMSPKALRQALLEHITTSWTASGTGSECRTAANLPWKELGTPEGQARYLVNHLDFLSMGFCCPTAIASRDILHEFSIKIISPHNSPLFNPPMTKSPSPRNSPEPYCPEQQDDAEPGMMATPFSRL